MGGISGYSRKSSESSGYGVGFVIYTPSPAKDRKGGVLFAGEEAYTVKRVEIRCA
jgi:hypothetical protein